VVFLAKLYCTIFTWQHTAFKTPVTSTIPELQPVCYYYTFTKRPPHK